MKRTITTVGLPLLAVLAIGLAAEGTLSAQDMTIDELIEEATAAEETLGNHILELDILTSYGDIEEEAYSTQWVKRDGDVTMTRIETGDEGDSLVIVDNGEETILYDEMNQEAYRLSDSESSMFITTPAAYLESLTEVYDITIVGTETLNDREAYHLSLEPSELYQEYVDEDSVLEMWLDTEYFVVLKQFEEDATYGLNESEFTNFETDADIDDSVFELELPEDVEIVDGLFNFGTDLEFEEFDFEDFDFDEEFDFENFDFDLETEEDTDVE